MPPEDPKEKGRQPKSIDKPLDTVLTENHDALIRPFVVVVNHGDKQNTSPESRCKSVDVPLPTQTSCNTFAVVLPEVRCHSVEKPLPTVTTKNGYGVVNPYITKYYGTATAQSLEQPLDTVTTRDRFGLVEPAVVSEAGQLAEEEMRLCPLIPLGNGMYLDIRFRMLQWHELAGAHGFPKGYVFTGNKSTKVKQIGNAVPRYSAFALCKERFKKYVKPAEPSRNKTLVQGPAAIA